MIRFGSWSTTLALAIGFGLVIAILLLTRRANRPANFWLSALVLVVVLRMVPYAIGYAGFYDAYPWLSFAPFDLSLALGPLLYFHVRMLTGLALPRRWLVHMFPFAGQLGYYAALFIQPLAFKNGWDEAVHARWVSPTESVLTLVSLGAYLLLSIRRYRAYQRWLVANVSDRDEHRQPWLRATLAAMAISLIVSAGFTLTDLFLVPLDYFDRFPLYLFFAALVLYLGVEGWRHADHRYPSGTEIAVEPMPAARDWRATGEQWSARIEREGWWREPALALADVARRLGTNQSYVSRALNEGLGCNFNTLINRMRVAEAKRAIARSAGPDDLLTIALDAGFSSKASFNRAFLDHAGMTPSAYRRQMASQIP